MLTPPTPSKPPDGPVNASNGVQVNTILHGDALDVLRSLPDACVDAVVTDPPAGISFMGKGWDSDKGGRDAWIAWLSSVMAEALRVLKPGGHALVWALPRTSHWTAMALEDAGFEVRDCVTHLFGSGFPKSLDVSKAIDKAAGAQREVVGYRVSDGGRSGGNNEFAHALNQPRVVDITSPATDAARAWDGWGTALKPAAEFWWLCRKPLGASTVAANVLAHGTGALNIGASRVVSEVSPKAWATPRGGIWRTDSDATATMVDNPAGRWPANLLLSHAADCVDGACSLWCPVRELDAQSGVRHSAGKYQRGSHAPWVGPASIPIDGMSSAQYGDTGGASRYFPTFRYQAKASRSERNRGCEELNIKAVHRYGAGLGQGQHPEAPVIERNSHPTVKPLALMSWLITLITPAGGVVLDPFTGSGSTLVAAKQGGWRYVGIEREAEYVAIAQARLAATQEPSLGSAVAIEQPKPVKPTKKPRPRKALPVEPLWETTA